MPAYHKSRNNVTITYRNKSYQADKSNKNFDQIISLLKEGNYREAITLVSKELTINTFGKGEIYVKNGSVYFKNKKITNKVATHIVKLAREGANYMHLVAFLENLLKNPESYVIEELYDFLNSGNVSITEDGHFLAYKKVKYNKSGDLVDAYSSTIRNNVGDVPTVTRESCDKNRHNTCSSGLHFCSKNYLSNYYCSEDSQVIIVKINPKDVTSIPSDYQFQKGRCCKYEVVSISPVEQGEELFTKSVMSVSDVKKIVKEKNNIDEDQFFMEGRMDRINQGTRKLSDKTTLQKASYNKGYYSIGFVELVNGNKVPVDKNTGRRIKGAPNKKAREQYRNVRGLRMANIKSVE